MVNTKTQYIRQTLELSYQFALNAFKLRTEGTWVGVFWYLLAPIITFLLMVNIFQDRLGTDIVNYPLYLLVGIVLFNFFQKVSQQTVTAIKYSGALIKSVNFPLESLVINKTITVLFGHFFEIVALCGFMIYFQIPISTMIYYPLVLLFLVLFTIGASLILASLGAIFFDLQEIWGFAVHLIWFITPIFYAVGTQDNLFILNMFNPMFFIITFARDLMIYAQMPQLHIILGTVGYSLLSLAVGLSLFHKLKRRFAELV